MRFHFVRKATAVILAVSLTAAPSFTVLAEEGTYTEQAGFTDQERTESGSGESFSDRESVVTSETGYDRPVEAEEIQLSEQVPVSSPVEESASVWAEGTADATQESEDIADSAYLEDWEYSVDEENGTVLLKKYIAFDNFLIIPAKAKLKGKEYQVVLRSTSAAESPFSGNETLEIVRFEDGVQFFRDIMFCTFNNCKNLKSVSNLPKVTSMQASFMGCENLLYVSNIPDTVKNMIGTFYDCSSLEVAPVIPQSVTDLSYTYTNCTSLQEAPVLPSGVVNMSYTFELCTGLTEAPVLPSKVTTLYGTFIGCTGIKKPPVIPAGVKNMQAVFEKCENLETAPVIPRGVTNMWAAFYGTAIKTPPVIPDTVTNLKGTFSGCKSLKTAPVIPASVQNMDSTFYRCISLQTGPVIPKSVTTMNYTFYECTNLQKGSDLPENVKFISDTYHGCSKLQGELLLVLDTTQPQFNAAGEKLYSFEECFFNAATEGSGLTVNFGNKCTRINEILATRGPGSKISIGQNAQLTSYTVTFVPRGGTVKPASKKVVSGKAYGTLPSPRRKGYAFTGWYTSRSGGRKVTAGTKAVLTKNIVLYARWSKVSVSAVKKVRLSNTRSGSMTVKISAVKGVSGYEILYARNKSFTRGKKRVSSSQLSKSIKKMKKGQTVYVKARAYKLDSAGKKIFGKYSPVNKIEIKK